MQRAAPRPRSLFWRRRLLPVVELLEERSSPTSLLSLSAGAAAAARGGPRGAGMVTEPTSHLNAAVVGVSALQVPGYNGTRRPGRPPAAVPAGAVPRPLLETGMADPVPQPLLAAGLFGNAGPVPAGADAGAPGSPAAAGTAGPDDRGAPIPHRPAVAPPPPLPASGGGDVRSQAVPRSGGPGQHPPGGAAAGPAGPPPSQPIPGGAQPLAHAAAAPGAPSATGAAPAAPAASGPQLPAASPLPAGNPLHPIIVTGTDAGEPPLVKVFDANTGLLKFQLVPYSASFTGGVRVAAADLNGDGIPDIITAPGPGMAPEVKVFDGKTGAQLPGPVGDFLAYDPSFTGGVFVTAADVNGDGTTDIITGPGAGGGSQVRAFSGKDASLLDAFSAYGPGYNAGVPVATSSWPGVGHAYVLAGSGPGSGEARLVDARTGAPLAGPLGDFQPYGPAFHGGVWVALGDVNGDGTPDVITGPGAGHTPEVKALSGRASKVPPLML